MPLCAGVQVELEVGVGLRNIGMRVQMFAVAVVGLRCSVLFTESSQYPLTRQDTLDSMVSIEAGYRIWARLPEVACGFFWG